MLLSASAISVSGDVLAILVLLLLSGLVSGSEVAFFSLKSQDYEKLAKENSPAARRILAMSEQPRTLLATILISNNFINIAIVLVSDKLVNKLLPPELFARWGDVLEGRLSFLNLSAVQLESAVNLFITVVLVTFLLVLFGEVAPKIYANMNRMKFALRMSGPLSFLMKLFAPLSKLLVNGTSLIEKRLARHTFSGDSFDLRNNIDQAIDLTVHADEDISREVDILKRIATFSEVPVRRIMRSRVDIVAVEESISFEKLLQTIRQSGYSRLPVYQEKLDNIIGLIYAKDLLAFLNEKSDFHWQKLIKNGKDSLLFVPETKKINDMLRVFQTKHLHLAIVVDEYGGTVGLVTLEDILEEIVGEIRDEFDEDEKPAFEKIDPCTYSFDGKTPLHDFFRELGIQEEEFEEWIEGAETVAGLLLEMAGGFPEEGQPIQTPNGKYTFEVAEKDKLRIKSVKVKINQINPEAESPENNSPCDTQS